MTKLSPRGRCAGCGRIGSLAQIRKHVVDCSAYLNLYRTDRDKALPPDSEFLRWSEEDNSLENRMAARESIRLARAEATDERIVAYRQRYATPADPLE